MKKFTLFLFLLSATFSFAQQKTLSTSDAVLGYYKGLYPVGLSNLQWVENTNTYVYQKENTLFFFDAKSNKQVSTITLEELSKSYTGLERLPYISRVTSENITFQSGNQIETYNYKTKTKSGLVTFDKNGQNTEYNHKAKAIAYTLDNNLFIGTSENARIAVTAFEDKNIVSGQAIHRSEFGIVKGTFWSPEGNYLAFYQKNEQYVTDYPLVDISTYPASLNQIKYPMAGQGSEQAKIGIYNLKKDKTIYLNIDTSDEHYLTNLSWSPDEKYVFVAEINRAQNHVWFNRYNAKTGEKVNTLFEEFNEAWTEPENAAVFLPKRKDEFLWMSERDGFMNLYHYTTAGKLIKQLTSFDWVVTGILGFDSKGKYVYISGTSEDARESHTYKVNIKSGKSTRLTKSSGTHSIGLNSAGSYLIDSYSSLSTPRNIDIVNTKNLKSTSILSAENPLKDYALGTTDFIDLKATDGTTLHAKMIKPSNFNPSKKYPVLVYVYGGPHAQLVTNSWLGGSSLWMPVFAENEDYIVFTLDNRGSAHRGFAFESVIHRNLGDAEMEDQLTGIDYLKSLEYIDIDRIALNGWSFGGYMTTSLMLRHPGIFTTVVAGGPVIDWKYYEVMYGERYMDTPNENPKGYEKTKVSNYITNLDGKMLIIHGSVDPVVVPQHSMTLLQAAVKNQVQIDFFTYPMHEHNVRGVDRVHLVEKMLAYILAHNK